MICMLTRDPAMAKVAGSGRKIAALSVTAGLVDLASELIKTIYSLD
jgi:hypothetical protein